MNLNLAVFDTWLKQAGYAGVLMATFIGNLGVPAVGTAGMALVVPFLLSKHWLLVAGLAATGETTGQMAQYCAARYGAGTLLTRVRRRTEARARERNRFENFYRRYGNLAVFICRFIPGVKSMSGFPAGLAKMSLAQFFLYTLLASCITWFGLGIIVHSLGRLPWP